MHKVQLDDIDTEAKKLTQLPASERVSFDGTDSHTQPGIPPSHSTRERPTWQPEGGHDATEPLS